MKQRFQITIQVEYDCSGDDDIGATDLEHAVSSCIQRHNLLIPDWSDVTVESHNVDVAEIA